MKIWDGRISEVQIRQRVVAEVWNISSPDFRRERGHLGRSVRHLAGRASLAFSLAGRMPTSAVWKPRAPAGSPAQRRSVTVAISICQCRHREKLAIIATVALIGDSRIGDGMAAIPPV